MKSLMNNRNVKKPANKGGGDSAVSSCTCPGNTWRQCTRQSVHSPAEEGKTASAPDGELHYRRGTCAALFHNEWFRFSILRHKKNYMICFFGIHSNWMIRNWLNAIDCFKITPKLLLNCSRFGRTEIPKRLHHWVQGIVSVICNFLTYLM